MFVYWYLQYDLRLEQLFLYNCCITTVFFTFELFMNRLLLKIKSTYYFDVGMSSLIQGCCSQIKFLIACREKVPIIVELKIHKGLSRNTVCMIEMRYIEQTILISV